MEVLIRAYAAGMKIIFQLLILYLLEKCVLPVSNAGAVR
jgi:hypothetical protein